MLRLRCEELLARTSAIELVGEPRMTGWPEWGTLSVPGAGFAPSLTSTRSTRRSCPTRIRPGRGSARECPVARGARWDFWR